MRGPCDTLPDHEKRPGDSRNWGEAMQLSVDESTEAITSAAGRKMR